MIATKSKVGRKRKHYVDPETGKQVYGLGHDLQAAGMLNGKNYQDDADEILMRIVGDEILRRPQWAAKKSGVEQLGYLRDLRPPAPLPTLDHLEEEWQKHARCGPTPKKKVLRAWRDFRNVAKITDIRDITPDCFASPSHGAYTAAASANVNSEICRLLGGHRCGIQDDYVRRNPKMVAPACEAVYAHYFQPAGA